MKKQQQSQKYVCIYIGKRNRYGRCVEFEMLWQQIDWVVNPKNKLYKSVSNCVNDLGKSLSYFKSLLELTFNNQKYTG